MKLLMRDSEDLEAHRDAITRLGETMNDPQLYARVYWACSAERAFLFESDECFVVLRPLGSGGLWIWLAESRRPVDRHYYLTELVHLARTIEAAFLGFGSDRPGFHRVAPALGFQPEPVEYRGLPMTLWRLPLEYDYVQRHYLG